MLGGFRLLVHGQEVTDAAWKRKKARQLLKFVLSRPHHRVLKEEALELFWPESDPTAASINLRSTLHAIRQALEPGGRASDGGAIVADRDTIGLQPGLDVWVDADTFERLAMEAQRTARPLPLLEEACALYAGEYLPEDLYEDWTGPRREALRRTWSELEFQLAQVHVQRGEPQAAVPELQRLLRSDRSDERAAQELMRVLIQLGRRSDAARVFQGLEQALRDDLGVEPSDASRELYRQVARLDAAATSGQFRPVFRCAYTFPEPGQFIGREAELERLLHIVDAGRSSGQTVLLSAPAGTGKSALAGAMLRSARDAGVLCLAGAAYDERTGVPLAAFQEALTDYVLSATSNPLDADVSTAASELMAAREDVRRSLATAVSARDERASERSRLFAAVLSLLRKLAERGPVLLCLEDLHAADAASLNLLHYLMRQTRHSPVVFVGTLRSEAIQPGEPLTQFVAAVERERLAERLELSPLNQAGTERLIAALAGKPVHGNLSASVYSATEGNPLFVEQLVFALREEGRLDRPAAVWQASVVDATSLPLVIRSVISERLARLSPRSREMLEWAAVLGHTFEYTDLLAVIEPSEEAMLLSDLDEAIRAQVIRERPTGYAFSHSLLRDGVYWALSRTRRMLLHGRAGEVLERLAGASALNMAAELAFHFARAGHTVPIKRKALTYSLRAGRQAAALASHREALLHFQTACTLVADPALEADPETRLAALEGRGLAERGMGMWPACIETFRQVLELVSEPIARAEARQVISFALTHTGDTPAALREAEAGLAELGPVAGDEPAGAVVRLELQHQLAFMVFLKGQFGNVLRLGTEMVEVAQRLDQPRWLGWAHSVVGWAHAGAGRVGLAIEQYERTLAATERGGDKLDIADAHSNLGIQNYRGGRFEAAHEHFEQAIALYRDVASDVRAVYALAGLGSVFLAEGNVGRASEYAEQAGALAAQANDRWMAECLQLTGALQVLRTEWAEAQASFERVLTIREQVGHTSGTVDALVQLGRIAASQGHIEVARELYERALSTAEGMDPGPSRMAAHRHLGLLLVRGGQVKAGAEHTRNAVTLEEQMLESLEFAPTLLAEAEVHWRQGFTSSALSLVERALAGPHTAELGVEAHALHAELLLAAQRPAAAEAEATAALDIAEGLGGPLLLALAHRAAGLVASAQADHTAATASLRAAARYLESAGAVESAGAARGGTPNGADAAGSTQSAH